MKKVKDKSKKMRESAFFLIAAIYKFEAVNFNYYLIHGNYVIIYMDLY